MTSADSRDLDTKPIAVLASLRSSRSASASAEIRITGLARPRGRAQSHGQVEFAFVQEVDVDQDDIRIVLLDKSLGSRAGRRGGHKRVPSRSNRPRAAPRSSALPSTINRRGAICSQHARAVGHQHCR